MIRAPFTAAPFTAAPFTAALIGAGLAIGAPALATTAPDARTAMSAAAETSAAAEAIRTAIGMLDQAFGADDQVVALTDVIRAYEEAQAALRDGLRNAAAREAEIQAGFNARRDTLGQMLAVMATIETAPETTLLLHPSGPEATARSGLLLAAVAPALQQQAATIKGSLDEIATIRATQEDAAGTLASVLGQLQQARQTLASATTDRSTVPTRFLDDPQELQSLVASADSLDDLAKGVAVLETDIGAPRTNFEEAEGGLPLPVMGSVLRRYNEPDKAGVSRPGIVIATRPRALVTTPWAATIRYRGPLLDYGNVMIIEPARDYLIVLAGMAQVFGETGDVLAAGDPVGLMGGDEGSPREFGVNFVVDTARPDSANSAETLYVELRRGQETLDPADWFVANAITAPVAPTDAGSEADGDSAMRAASAHTSMTQAPVTGGAATNGTDG